MNDAERAADAISKIAAAYAKDIAEAAGLTEVEEKMRKVALVACIYKTTAFLSSTRGIIYGKSSKSRCGYR